MRERGWQRCDRRSDSIQNVTVHVSAGVWGPADILGAAVLHCWWLFWPKTSPDYSAACLLWAQRCCCSSVVISTKVAALKLVEIYWDELQAHLWSSCRCSQNEAYFLIIDMLIGVFFRKALFGSEDAGDLAEHGKHFVLLLGHNIIWQSTKKCVLSWSR